MGHRAPYAAVITLSVMTAHYWRVLRLKLIQSGVSDPMSLPNMHYVLDSAESAFLEAIANEGSKDAEFKRTQFLDKLYSPVSEAITSGDPKVDTPPGFSEEEMAASFDAFAAVAL